MDTDVEKEGLKHLESIERKLNSIKSRTPSSKRSFKNGIFQGMGAVIGSIIAVALIGLLLSFLGIVPGLDHLAVYIQNVMDSMHSR